jgi:hypothetical protein
MRSIFTAIPFMIAEPEPFLPRRRQGRKKMLSNRLPQSSSQENADFARVFLGGAYQEKIAEKGERKK